MHKLQDSIDSSENNETSVTVLRRVQAYTGEKSLTVVILRTFVQELEIQKGDYLKVNVEGKKIVLEKTDIQ